MSDSLPLHGERTGRQRENQLVDEKCNVTSKVHSQAHNKAFIFLKLMHQSTSMTKDLTNYIRQRWEKEANTLISEEMWL